MDFIDKLIQPLLLVPPNTKENKSLL